MQSSSNKKKWAMSPTINGDRIALAVRGPANRAFKQKLRAKPRHNSSDPRSPPHHLRNMCGLTKEFQPVTART